METITLYLEKFKNLTPPESSVRSAVVASVYELCKESIPDVAVSVRGTTVFVRVHPTLKTELFIQKDAVIHAINLRLSGRRVREVR